MTEILRMNEMILQMTGRKGRIVQNNDGIQYESRSESDVPLEVLNLTEKQRFMDGEKVLLDSFFFSIFLCRCFVGYQFWEEYGFYNVFIC